MSNGWEQVEAVSNKHTNNGGIFVRLANHGDSAVGAFCGEPYATEVHWTGTKYEKCQGDGCPLCETSKKSSLRVAINFFTPEDGQMKIIEGGPVWFKDVLKLRDKYGLNNWLFEIERNGDAGDTNTKYSILPESKISEALNEQIAKAQLHDIAGFKAEDEDPLISDDEALSLIPRLKALPRQMSEEFLREMRVKRVRDLRVSALDAAGQLVKELEVRLSREVAQDDSIDPFA